MLRERGRERLTDARERKREKVEKWWDERDAKRVRCTCYIVQFSTPPVVLIGSRVNQTNFIKLSIIDKPRNSWPKKVSSIIPFDRTLKCSSCFYFWFFFLLFDMDKFRSISLDRSDLTSGSNWPSVWNKKHSIFQFLSVFWIFFSPQTLRINRISNKKKTISKMSVYTRIKMKEMKKLKRVPKNQAAWIRVESPIQTVASVCGRKLFNTVSTRGQTLARRL